MNENDQKLNKYNIDIEEMAKEGVHLGRTVSKRHPKMQKYIVGIKNNCHIINLENTKEELEKALDLLSSLKKEQKIILFVATNPPINKFVEKFAKEINTPYITQRWLGGTLTNFPQILKRINFYKNLKEKLEKGELEKYTKKEKAKFLKQLKELELKFAGISNLEKLPDAIFICDVAKEKTCLKEARKMEIPIIGVCNTDADPTKVNFPIPANTISINSVLYILNFVKEVLK
ncbi:MAG: 30S ribosomal protein S2 [Minisyncoccia bacterium]